MMSSLRWTHQGSDWSAHHLQPDSWRVETGHQRTGETDITSEDRWDISSVDIPVELMSHGLVLRWRRCLWSETPSWNVRFVVSLWCPDGHGPCGRLSTWLRTVSLSAGFHEPRSRCSPNPCYKGISCVDSLDYPGYTCGPCKPGLRGNGTHCQDIDEVTRQER